ncbi:MAG: hypothetical protein WAV21_02655 [Minisyncoccia bacterium]
MKVTHETLQSYFEKPLPSVAEIADAFTFHCFEIDEVAGNMLDIKVLPNRAADCNTEQGIAYELSSILDVSLKTPPVPDYTNAPVVEVSLARINGTLGADFSQAEVEDVFRRLRFEVVQDGEIFRVRAPYPRTDIAIAEDVVEEVGRILGYDRIAPKELAAPETPAGQARFRGIERVKDVLIEKGFTEISTQSFAKKGDIILANPLDKEKPALRTSLGENMLEALVKAKHYAPRVLPPGVHPKLFEVGTIFTKEGEKLVVETSEPVSDMPRVEEDSTYVPILYRLGPYRSFSTYPFATRDIAVWVPSETPSASIEKLITDAAGTLLVRIDEFDRFEKEGRTSYAFRLVFESMDRTLTDAELQTVMQKVTVALTGKDYEVR